jgi:hypothetical protein
MSGRIELKYLVDWRQREILLKTFRPYLEAAAHTDERASYPILSLYFDTPSLLFYDEKVDGEMLRTKVRLRGYGVEISRLAPLFLEIKRKVDSRILKYRKQFDRFEPALLEPAAWRLGADPQAAQIAAAFHRYRLRPAVQTLYRRETWESPFVRTLRLSFDSQLLALYPGQRFERSLLDDDRHRCLADTQFIFEIKSDGRLPPWIIEAIHAAGLVQRAISKYVLCIDKLGLAQKEIGVYA